MTTTARSQTIDVSLLGHLYRVPESDVHAFCVWAAFERCRIEAGAPPAPNARWLVTDTPQRITRVA